jgi:hypothetical protein
MEMPKIPGGQVPQDLMKYLVDQNLVDQLKGGAQSGSSGMFGMPSMVAPQMPKIPGMQK